MKKPIADLVDEHGGIMLMLKILKQAANNLEKGKEVKKEHLEKIIEFLKEFADKCHHGKEEGILFPYLSQYKDNEKLLNELLGEHKTGRDYIRGIMESAGNLQAGNPDAYHIAANMKGYVNLLTEHIRKENMILFPLADKQLLQEEQKEIEEKFETLEREVIGIGKHDEYHGWLRELSEFYINN